MTNTTVPTDAEIEAAYRKVWSTVPHAQRLTAFAHEIGATLAARWGAPAPASGEPFGYFRADPFGWTDCAATDEGAIALYEKPQAPEVRVPLSDEQIDELASPYLLRMFGTGKIFPEVMRGFARAIERAHGITAKEPT